ncbi:hypothetical protein SDC9_32069 [bioreactor metagenome]|uniref:Uncharacterized protein n=1 Tax=bioreactor metagenome TaxID=1076179 RepID=A0A644V5K0_9ZZZZ
MRPRLLHRGQRRRHRGRDRPARQNAERHRQKGQHRERHLARLDLAAKVFRGAPDHQPGQEDRQHDIEQHPVKPGADAAEDHLTDHHVDHLDKARERHETVVHRIDRAIGGRRRRRGPKGGETGAEALFLALHVGAEAKGRVAARLAPPDHHEAKDEHHAHGGKDRPALPAVLRHPAEDEAEGDGNEQDRQALDHVRQHRRVLERMGRVHAEEAAAIGAKLLDGNLCGGGAARDHLIGAFDRGCVHRPEQRLRHALHGQHQRHHHRQRQQHIENRARHVGPEIAKPRAPLAGEAADHRDADCHAGCRRNEVLHRQTGHLREIAELRLAGIGLPVGVGDEADRGVEGQISRHAGNAVGVHRQGALQAQDRIEGNEPRQVEDQNGKRIGLPALRNIGPDAGKAVEAALERAENGRKRRGLCGIDTGHQAGQRPPAGRQHRAKEEISQKVLHRRPFRNGPDATAPGSGNRTSPPRRRGPG